MNKINSKKIIFAVILFIFLFLIDFIEAKSQTIDIRYPLKAVIIVGPIDGNDGDNTKYQILHAEGLAKTFEQNGVKVIKFYTPNNSWNEIIVSSRNANFLVYRGHGLSWGGQPENVGGFYLNDDLISSDTIRKSLRLAPNALVMIYACYAAGSANSDYPLGVDLNEAARRVYQYSYPFFEIGASAYFSSWYGSDFNNFIQAVFDDRNFGEAYRSFNYDGNFSELKNVNGFKGVIWINYQFYNNINQYNRSFVGYPDYKLNNLFFKILDYFIFPLLRK